MSFALRFSSAALDHFTDFVAWYLEFFPAASERDTVRMVYEGFRVYRSNPLLKQIDSFPFPSIKELRHITIWKFNFYYEALVEEHVIHVVAIVHEAAGPESTQARLGER